MMAEEAPVVDPMTLALSPPPSTSTLTAYALEFPAVIDGAGERAGRRFVEFFTAHIRNPHTRGAYATAVSGSRLDQSTTIKFKMGVHSTWSRYLEGM